MSASSGYSQDSKRLTLITKCEQAVDEALKSREYIKELESSYEKLQAQIVELEKLGQVSKSELAAKTTEAEELRTSIEALKAANSERVREIGKMQKQINKLEGRVSFWRKVAVVSAAVAAAVVLTR